ncbi:hypothetical protein K4F52_004919 [Lecanicillium sp. MT-2017a]|nr:hypothetical protein K4F52_004919 [Lecanicillium sp. MT-2017a]
MMKLQPVAAPLTQCAVFLVVSAVESPGALATIRDALGSICDLTKNVSIRHPSSNLSCTVGIGSAVWDSLTKLPRPRELHPFREIAGAKHKAVATPGDLLFHIRSERRDVCFEFESQLMEKLGDSIKVNDETIGFRYFDARDLLGFVDGTANPSGDEISEAAFVTSSVDAAGVGGSYVVVQKYVHDMAAWKALTTEQQEAIIGRRKIDNFELEDADEGQQQAHKTLTTIEDDDGNEYAILRDNMPFGSPASKEYGTYFIGYSNRLWVIEKMLERMFVGHPPGRHDKILDYSVPLTGATFFVPSAAMLDSIGD